MDFPAKTAEERNRRSARKGNMSRNPLALIVLLALTLNCRAGEPATNALENSSQAMGSNQKISCRFVAAVVSLAEMTNAPIRGGYLVDTNGYWRLVLAVKEHSQKIPFQPGVRECWITSPARVFGVPAAKVKGTYRFNYMWNIDVPGRPKFEDFKANR
jgi:hypothetical protein